MNLADPELELVDPTPNVHSLFVHFDSVFFWAALAGRALVRWSKRMYSCAGVCSYEGRHGICDIALSEPLLKLRPRKDLVETLLHEMIHAFLFITSRDNDRDGHGPNFKAHMHRINKAAGLNISIYHDFHDEVELYLRHWWRCNGPCQTKKPYFGVVRRYLNKPPGPSDYWWNMHRRSCGGTFIKIKEPENVKKPTIKKPRAKENPKDGMKQKVLDIYINTGKEITTTIDKDKQMKKVPPLTIHNGQTNRKSLETNSVIEKVRNVWINKQLPKAINTQTRTANKHKINSHVDSPPKKMKKIDDYFKNASSLLKDVYGDQIEVLISSSSNKLITITNKEHINDKIDKVNVDLVECPNCNSKVSNQDINRHLDECLNKEIIEKLTKDEPITSQTDTGRTINLVGKILDIPPLKDETDRIKTERAPTFENKKVTKRQTDFIIPKTEFTIKAEPGTSKDIKHEHIDNIESNQKDTEIDQKCPCCGNKVDKPIVEHLDECLAFDNTTIPTEGNSAIETIIIDDDDDKFDETLTFNATGTKSPCPCCMKMIEISNMYDHLDVCLNT